MRLHAACVAIVLTTMAARPAAADTPPPPEWYGWQTLTVDASASLVVLAAATSGAVDLRLVEAAALVYLVGGPVVHAAHGQPRTALLSLATRVVLPLTTIAVVDRVGGAGSTGAIAAIALPVAIDASLLAWQRPEPAAQPDMTPAVIPIMGGVTVGVRGTF